MLHPVLFCLVFFFFMDPASPELYTLSLHDALPICAAVKPGWGSPREDYSRPVRGPRQPRLRGDRAQPPLRLGGVRAPGRADRKSTRLNSSHEWISYAVFCLKKKKNT